VTLRLTTWNIQGRAGPDLRAVAGVLRTREPDVVLLQEVQRRQAQALAAELGWSLGWRWKHWPVVLPAEGLAVLASGPVDGIEVEALAQPWSFWSSDRRIAVAADVDGARVVVTHLGAGVGDVERSRQARRVARFAGPHGVIAGDLNTDPASSVIRTFRDAGFVDAWSEIHTEADRGFTNWGGGRRTEPPTRRLDYVLAGPGVAVVAAEVPSFGDPDFDRFGVLSDHLPLTVTLDLA
jgi:endonuclease/exonuclease/phosphatase family metal-dependent hydrolase